MFPKQTVGRLLVAAALSVSLLAACTPAAGTPDITTPGVTVPDVARGGSPVLDQLDHLTNQYHDIPFALPEMTDDQMQQLSEQTTDLMGDVSTLLRQLDSVHQEMPAERQQAVAPYLDHMRATTENMQQVIADFTPLSEPAVYALAPDAGLDAIGEKVEQLQSEVEREAHRMDREQLAQLIGLTGQMLNEIELMAQQMQPELQQLSEDERRQLGETIASIEQTLNEMAGMLQQAQPAGTPAAAPTPATEMTPAPATTPGSS